MSSWARSCDAVHPEGHQAFLAHRVFVHGQAVNHLPQRPSIALTQSSDIEGRWGQGPSGDRAVPYFFFALKAKFDYPRIAPIRRQFTPLSVHKHPRTLVAEPKQRQMLPPVARGTHP
jgi:hypothetical protein